MEIDDKQIIVPAETVDILEAKVLDNNRREIEKIKEAVILHKRNQEHLEEKEQEENEEKMVWDWKPRRMPIAARYKMEDQREYNFENIKSKSKKVFYQIELIKSFPIIKWWLLLLLFGHYS